MDWSGEYRLRAVRCGRATGLLGPVGQSSKKSVQEFVQDRGNQNYGPVQEPSPENVKALRQYLWNRSEVFKL